MDNVLLDGGLDLVRARPAVLPGRIKECLNYEVGWQRGYARIDGWERYDGHISPSATDYWVVTLPVADIAGTVLNQPTSLVWEYQGETGGAGQLVEYTVTPDVGGDIASLSIVFRQGRLRPEYDSVISDEAGTWSLLLDSATVTVVKLSDTASNHEDFLGTLSTYAEILRGVVRPVPGGGTIVGLHYHEDQLYAIRDAARVSVASGDVTNLKAGMYVYNTAGQLGEVVKADAEANEFHIAPVDADGFSVVKDEVISVAMSARFINGAGAFKKGDAVTSGAWAAAVGLVERRDGSFDSGNALGVAVFTDGPDSPVPQPAEIITGPDGTMEMDSMLFAPQANAATIGTVYATAEVAALWRSTDDGWEAATSGRVVAFTGGTNDPFSQTPVADSIEKLGTETYQATTSSSPDWSLPLEDILTDGPRTSTSASGNPSIPVEGVSDSLAVKNFKFGLLDDAEITGLEVTFNGFDSQTGTSSMRVKLISNSSGDRSFSLDQVGGVPIDHVVGGINTHWSPGGHTPAQLNDAGFGIRFFASSYNVTAPEINTVKIKVHFTLLPSSKVYMWDGTQDIGTLNLSEAVVQSGDWSTNDAAGYFRLKDWDLVDLPEGVTLHTQPGATGLLIANLTGSVSRPVLPGSKLLNEEHSKYQIISYNFFATEEKNAIYGVNGAGPAFWYDGTTLDFILTGVDEDKDKPRHIAPHENRLHLGYIWGEVYASGPDPTVFNFQTGLAATYGFGDKITGLMPAAGKALAVFTESASHVLIGAVQGFGEASLEGVEQRVINHKVGAIEYTVQNIGNRPIFASFRGIETFETMDQYSDFFTAPLTYDVSPWLLDRLQTAAGVETSDKSVVNSVVVRNKNQYRLFFADGYVLTLTYVGPEKEPQNTIQQYWFDDDRTKYVRVFATASGVSTSGQDHAFFSTEERRATPDVSTQVASPNTDFVYELDRGRSFDGGPIEAYIELTHYYSKDPQTGAPLPTTTKVFNVIQLHGKVAGYATLRVSRSVNYEDLDDPELPYEPLPFGSLDMKPENETHEKYSKGRITARGFAVSVRIAHKSAVEFPHVVQMLTFLDDRTTRLDR